MVALGGFPRFAAKFKSNKGSLARHICHWMNLCKTVERKALLCLCYWLWVKSTFGLLPTQSLWSPTQLCEFDTDLDNSMVLPEMWLGSGLIASILHQFCSYFKEIFNIKLCQCKELCFSSVSQTIWQVVGLTTLVPDMNPRFAEKAKEEIQCRAVELGSALGTSITYRLQTFYPLTLSVPWRILNELTIFATKFEGS